MTIPAADIFAWCNQIIAAGFNRIDVFHSDILGVLHQSLNAKALSFYSYSTQDKILCLRSQIGLSYDDYSSFQLSVHSTAGTCIDTACVQLFRNLKARDDYRDKALLEKYQLTSMIAIPLMSNMRLYKDSTPLGVICFYPRFDEQLEDIAETIRSLAPIISSAYITSIQQTKLFIREHIIEKAVISSDLPSFFHRSISSLRTKWPFQAASVFIYDPRSECLRLHATTKLRTDRRKHDTFYKLSDPYKTPRAFNTSTTIIINQQSDTIYAASKYVEVVPIAVTSCIILPIKRPGATDLARGPEGNVGVARFVNRTAILGQKTEALPFAEEDIAIAEFLGTVFGVITHLYSMVARKTADFERAIHGIHNNILGVQARLNQLDRYAKVSERHTSFIHYEIPSVFEYNLTDCLALMDSVAQQITVFHTRDILEFSKIEKRSFAIYADVIAKVVSFIKLFGRVHDVSDVRIDYGDFEGDQLRNIPLVMADQEMLVTVLRNLAENAVKYSKSSGPCYIKLSWSADERYIYIHFMDRGVGVSKGDRKDVFLEGFQAESFMRRQPSGTGLGLYQCKQIMLALGGDIYFTEPVDLEEPSYETVFTVKVCRASVATRNEEA